MKKIVITLAAAIVMAGLLNIEMASACTVSIAETSFSEASAAKSELKTVIFDTKMHCEKCVKKVKENIAFEKGVKDLKVSLEANTIEIVYDAKKTDESKLAAAIKKLGYPAVKRTTNK